MSMLRRLVSHIRAKPKRALKGLWHGAEIRFGNQVSHSDRKTRRTWKPNVLRRSYFSELLDERIQIKVVARVTRTIDKYHGFDNYIVLTHPKYLEGIGMKLKERMLETLRTKPELRPDDFLNVSPACWDYLANWDAKQAAIKQKLDEEADREEELQIRREEAMINGEEPPKEPRKKKKSLKLKCIEGRLQKRARNEHHAKIRGHVMHGHEYKGWKGAELATLKVTREGRKNKATNDA